MEKLIPFETESAFIAGFMLAPETPIDLEPEDIASPEIREIYEILRMATCQDLLEITAEIERQGKIQVCGGRDFLLDLWRNGAPVNLQHKANIIKDRAAARRLALVAVEVGKRAHDIHTPISESIQACRNLLDTVERFHETEYSLEDELAECVKLIESRSESGSGRIQSGVRAIDEQTGGFGRGELVIIGGRPSHGKTALGMQIARNIAMAGGACLIFSLEMSRHSLLERMLASLAFVPANKLRDGKLSTEDFGKISLAISALRGKNLIINDSAQVNCSKIQAEARKLRKKYGNLDCIMIDYLQLMQGEGQNRLEEITKISRELKLLAREIDCPVILLSQLSRKCEERADKRPMMSDLRESGAIEQDADIIIFVYRASVYTHDGDTLTELIVDKNRQGVPGTIYQEWEGEHLLFTGTMRRPESDKPKRGF